MEQKTLGSFGWWWVVVVSVPFGVYSLPFVSGVFDIYKHLTLAALAGRYDIAGLHIAKYVAVWQVHALLGLAFMIVAPFQFSGSFRNRHLDLHRKMGYVFVGASLVLASTGSTVMSVNSEFKLLGQLVMSVGGFLQGCSVVKAVIAARQKRILEHRCWMIRAAVMGYAVINARIVLILLQKVFNIPVFSASDYSIAVSWTLNVAVAEFYIQRYLIGKRVATKSKDK